MTALDVVEQDTKTFDDSLHKESMRMILLSVGTPSSRELAICESTGRSPRKQLEPPKPDMLKDHVSTLLVVAALIASVTGFTVPGGYNGSGSSRAMYNVFVIGNFIAMNSSIMAILTLLWIPDNDPRVTVEAISLGKILSWVALVSMPLAFMAGVYVTVTKFKWLSSFVLVFGSFTLYFILSSIMVLSLPVFEDSIVYCFLGIARRWRARIGTVGREATSTRGTRDDNLCNLLE